MLVTLVLVSYISVAMYLSGLLFYLLIGAADRLEHKHPVLVLLTGTSVQLLAAQIMVLFGSVHIGTSIWLNLLVCGVLLVQKPKTLKAISKNLLAIKEVGLPSRIIFMAISMVLIMTTAGPTLMDDTDSYHLQNIAWMHDWGTVPGLANLHLRYGFHTSWHSGAALYSFPSNNNYYTALNGALSIWLAFYLLFPAFSVANRTKTSLGIYIAGTGLLLLSLLIWSILRKNSSTTNYDFIAAVCTLVIVAEAIKPTISLTTYETPPIEWLLYPLMLLTVRLINFPLLLLCFVFLYVHRRQVSLAKLAGYTTLAAAFTIPFVVRNYILSGYPLFPSMAFDIGNPQWKADASQVADILRYIKYFNRINNAFIDTEETATYGFPQWIAPWYQYLFSFDKIIFLTGVSGYAFYLLFQRKKSNKKTKYVLIIFSLQFLTWFFVAPDPRFIYGIFLGGIFLLFYTTSQLLPERTLPFLHLASGIACLLFSGFILIRTLNKNPLYRNLFTPVALPNPAIEEKWVDGVRMVIPQKVLNNWNPRCYNLKPPCLYSLDNRLHLRGPSISQGFYLQATETTIK